LDSSDRIERVQEEGRTHVLIAKNNGKP
jgi:hypothetical protein